MSAAQYSVEARTGRRRGAGRACRTAMLAGAAIATVALLGSPAPAAAGPATTAAPAPRAPQSQQARPNILFVLIDDMGWADLSVMGDRKVQTPNLDKLARDGVLLTKFYDAAPICSASRAGFMTGRFPAEMGFYSYEGSRESNHKLGQVDWLDPKVPTMARMLQHAGYATAHIGKWHLGGGRDIGDAPWPTAYGFDQSFTTFEGLGPRVLVSDQERFLAEQSDELGEGARFWEIKTKLTQLYCNMTVDFVAQHADKPWFVNLWFNDVHDPWAPDDDSLSDVMGKGTSSDDDRYLATLVKMDHTVGKLFERLDQMGEMDNTLVIVTSDNGPSSRQIYYQDGETAPGSVAHLRGRKWSNYEGGIRQPLILYWRGHMKPGTVDRTTVGQGVDLFPTIARIIGETAPESLEGVDLSPVLMGTPVTERPPMFYAYGKEGAPQQPPSPADPHDVAPPFAVRDGDWKLLAQAGGAKPELYNIASDPTESTNVAARNPAVRDRLLDKLRQWMTRLK